jgi:hypothetical protein
VMARAGRVATGRSKAVGGRERSPVDPHGHGMSP